MMTSATRGVAALLALWLSGCTPAPQSPLVVGTQTWAGTELLFLARDQGRWPAGSIHLAEYMSATQPLRALRNGAVDAITTTVDEVLNLDRLDQQAQVVLVLDASQGGDCVVARPGIEALAQLEGRRIASEDATLPAYILHRALERPGLRLEQVQRVFHAPEEHEALFRRGEVDAVVSYQPYCHRLEGAGARVIFSSADIPGEVVDVLVVRRSYLEQHPERVESLVRGWFEALAWFHAHPEEAARRMGPRLGFEGTQLLEVMKGVHHPGLGEQRQLLVGAQARLRQTMARMGRLMVQQRLLHAPPDTEHLIDTAPLLQVAP